MYKLNDFVLPSATEVLEPFSVSKGQLLHMVFNIEGQESSTYAKVEAIVRLEGDNAPDGAVIIGSVDAVTQGDNVAIMPYNKMVVCIHVGDCAEHRDAVDTLAEVAASYQAVPQPIRAKAA